jgi:hypothetical protein
MCKCDHNRLYIKTGKNSSPLFRNENRQEALCKTKFAKGLVEGLKINTAVIVSRREQYEKAERRLRRYVLTYESICSRSDTLQQRCNATACTNFIEKFTNLDYEITIDRDAIQTYDQYYCTRFG